jgi:hypothetical protein
MANREDGEGNKSFQVVDKRRFDSGGNERGVDSPSEPAQPQRSSTQETATNFRMEEPTHGAPEVTFSSFVMSLATQAMVQLGQMSPPPGMDIPVDVESGRGTIDILAMIQQKTLGNLSKEEAKFLEDVLHTLRVSYVRKAGAPS